MCKGCLASLRFLNTWMLNDLYLIGLHITNQGRHFHFYWPIAKNTDDEVTPVKGG